MLLLWIPGLMKCENSMGWQMEQPTQITRKEYVWVKGTGERNRCVETVVWESHSKICYPFILEPGLRPWNNGFFQSLCFIHLCSRSTISDPQQVLSKCLLDIKHFCVSVQEAECPPNSQATVSHFLSLLVYPLAVQGTLLVYPVYPLSVYPKSS